MSSAGYLVVSLSLWHLTASVLSPSDCKHAEEGDFLWAVVSMRFPDVKPSLSAFGWWEVGTMSSPVYIHVRVMLFQKWGVIDLLLCTWSLSGSSDTGNKVTCQSGQRRAFS